MKQKTITCPFCQTEMPAIECAIIPCPTCKQDVILEKEMSDNIEDNLYFLSSTLYEKSKTVANLAETYFRDKKFTEAYEAAKSAESLNRKNVKAHFIMLASKICIVESLDPKLVSKQHVEEIKKIFNDAANNCISNEVEFSVIDDAYKQFIDKYGNIGNDTKETVKTETKTEINSDLKSDIKSVLLYMDQLLENLPEEKIMEFAHSDEFATYKKLFNELGLS